MDNIISNVLSKYGVHPIKCTLIKQEKDRMIWEVVGEKGKYALKSVSAGKAQRIPSIGLYLASKGIPVITVLPTLKGDFVVNIQNYFFILFPWFEGESIRYDTPGTIERMSSLLAQFHEASRGYTATGKPVKKANFHLLRGYKKKLKYMENIYNELSSVDDQMVKILSNHFVWLRKRCNWVIKELSRSSYQTLLETAELNPILGHGDYSKENILSDKSGNWKIIDLDTAGISLSVVDISKMLTWINFYFCHWDTSRYQTILDCYRKIRPFSREEERLLMIDQCFPHQAISLLKSYCASGIPVEQFERCLATDKEKINEFSIKNLKWRSS